MSTHIYWLQYMYDTMQVRETGFKRTPSNGHTMILVAPMPLASAAHLTHRSILTCVAEPEVMVEAATAVVGSL